MEIFPIWIILSWFGIFSDKCFLLVWVGKRGWVVGGALFENLQSHRWNIRRPKFSLCHEIWWTLNPTFKWEKILHQDTIYPQLMSLRRKLWSNAIAESDLNLTHTYLRISWNNHLMKTQLQFVENKKYFVLSLSWNMCFLEFLWTGNGIRSQGWDGIWSWGNLFWYYLTTIKNCTALCVLFEVPGGGDGGPACVGMRSTPLTPGLRPWWSHLVFRGQLVRVANYATKA